MNCTRIFIMPGSAIHRNVPDDIVRDDYFWVKLTIDERPAFVLSHRLIANSEDMQLVGVRDYYISHFFDVSQRVAVVARLESGKHILIFVERAWVDYWSGFAAGQEDRLQGHEASRWSIYWKITEYADIRLHLPRQIRKSVLVLLAAVLLLAACATPLKPHPLPDSFALPPDPAAVEWEPSAEQSADRRGDFLVRYTGCGTGRTALASGAYGYGNIITRCPVFHLAG